MFRKIVAVWVSLAMLFGLVVIVDVVTDIAPPVKAATITVDDSGGAMYTKIQDGIDAANAGDTVFVYNGIYYENVVVNKTINLTGEDRDTTIIDGSGIGDVIKVVSDWVNISGFTILGSGDNLFDSGISILSYTTYQNIRCDPTLTPESYVLYQLTNRDKYEGKPAFHPDGNKIAYSINEEDSTRANIWVMDIDGSNKIRLTDESKFEEFPHFSPDGEKIVYNSLLSGGYDWQIHIMNADGTNRTQLTVEDRKYYHPIFHPTNNKIYYTDGNVSDIFCMEQDGTNITRVTSYSDVTGGGICFDSTGRYLLYDKKADELWKVDLETNTRESLGGNGYSHPEYSVDDSKIVYSHFNDGPFIMDSDGTNNTMLHEYLINSSRPTINERWDIAFESDRNGDKYWDVWVLDKRPFITSFSILEKSGLLEINLHFNEPVIPSSVENAFIVKKYDNNETVLGTIQWNMNNDILTFQSLDRLDHGPVYMANLSYNCWDENFNMLEKNYSWSFNLPFDPYISESHCRIINCNLSMNGGYGIFINWSMGNIIEDNIFYSNSHSGVYMQNSTLNDIKQNIFSNNMYGIYLDYSDNSSIISNVISNNVFGIYINSSSNNNTFHHNFIINNVNQTFLYNSTYSTNDWDDGLGEGNYWSDYTGSDDGSNGRFAGDGVGDTLIPHPFIDQGDGYYNLDNFPIMEYLPPQIQLISPFNNTVNPNGTILDFNIIDPNLDHATYSVNSGDEKTFLEPYNIDTGGWSDGDYTIQINATDVLGNYNSSWYFITIDSTIPIINLNSPENNSLIVSGTVLDFSVIDENLGQSNYSINGGPSIPISDPFNISTSGWNDGLYLIQFYAMDMVGNTKSNSFNFTIDSTLPVINLITPSNNSVIPEGTFLNFSIFDIYLSVANYSINGEETFDLIGPFEISTDDWEDGSYIIHIFAIDETGNSNSSSFLFYIDSTRPMIQLITPRNNSVVQKRTILDFDIIDDYLIGVNISIDGEELIPITAPFDITAEWSDGAHTIGIHALDIIGNSNSSSYQFIIDSTPPVINIDPSLNHSVIPVGNIIEINISAEDLNSAAYSINEGEYIRLDSPYTIDTSNWKDGSYKIAIKANDSVGNEAEIWLVIKVDATIPYVINTNPSHESTEFDIGGSIIISFSEEINKIDIESNLSIYPYNNFTHQWLSEDTLQISFYTSNLALGTTYNLTIYGTIMDSHGNLMGSDFLLTFTTRFLDSDNDGTPDHEDEDDDNDGHLDDEDDFPLDETEWQDFDGDGVGDNADLDDDDDGHPDSEDVYPYDPDRWREKEEKQSSNILPILALVVAIIVVLLIVYFFILRKRGGGSEKIEWEEAPGIGDQEPGEENITFEEISPSDEAKEVE